MGLTPVPIPQAPPEMSQPEVPYHPVPSIRIPQGQDEAWEGVRPYLATCRYYLARPSSLDRIAWLARGMQTTQVGSAADGPWGWGLPCTSRHPPSLRSWRCTPVLVHQNVQLPQALLQPVVSRYPAPRDSPVLSLPPPGRTARACSHIREELFRQLFWGGGGAVPLGIGCEPHRGTAF